MPITIATSEEDYESVAWLISELESSDTVGFHQVRDLLEPLAGFSDGGLTDAERAGNYVRVLHYATFTDLLAASLPLRLHSVTLTTSPSTSASQTKFAVRYRDNLCDPRTIHVFASSSDEAAEYVTEHGYGVANGRTLFPLKIDCVEEVPLHSVLS